MKNWKRTACGPDELPYWIFRDYAYFLAPVVASDAFNNSLRKQTLVPSIWKKANLKPLPNESLLTTSSQLRPISLTAIVMHLFERLVCTYELVDICNSYIDSNQFAYRQARNSTMALIMCQHTWLKWLDGDTNFVRIFSLDLSRAFDYVSHSILCTELKNININYCVINRLISFLNNSNKL